MNLFSLFKKHNEKPKPLRLAPKSPGLTSYQFRLDENAIARAKALLATDTFKIMVEILRNEDPIRMGLLPRGATDMDVARAFGAQEGYHAFIAQLENLCVPVEKREEVEETFTDENKDQMLWTQP